MASQASLLPVEDAIAIRRYNPKTDRVAVLKIISDAHIDDGGFALFKILALSLLLPASFLMEANAVVMWLHGASLFQVILKILLELGIYLLVLFYCSKWIMQYYAKISAKWEDLADIPAHYNSEREGKVFWVATMPQKGYTVVCGCIALDDANRSPSDEWEKWINEKIWDRQREEIKNRARWGEVRHLSVAAWAQKRGVAQKLYTKLATHAQKIGLRGLLTRASSIQPVACAFFSKKGYSISHRVRAPMRYCRKHLVFREYEKRLT